jgi:SAM-dependent methyltransferase
MRKASLDDCLTVLEQFDVDPKRAKAIDVGGSETVNLDGEFVPNPLLTLCDDLTLLDGGFSVERMQTTADTVSDFLAEETITPLESRFDLVFSFDTLEHVSNPFLFCEHLVAITKPGGYVFAATLFSWTYHPAPQDYYRFSPAGMRELFENEYNRRRNEFDALRYGWGSDRKGKGVFLFGCRRSNPE